MTELRPRISVLIPAYNHAAYIGECVASVWEQEEPGIEIVLIDDGSTDGTGEAALTLAERSPIPMQVVIQENRGSNRTLNRALRMARGEYVALLASDDKFAPNRFAAQLHLFAAHPEVQVVYGNGRFWQDGKLGERVHPEAVRKLLSRSAEGVLHHLYTNVSPLYVQTCLCKREFLLRIGGFDEAVLADDWVLNLRIFRALTAVGSFGYVDEDVFFYRRHDSNSSMNLVGQANRVIEVIDSYTPLPLRAEFKRRMYRHYAWIALCGRNLPLAVLYLLRGELAGLRNPRRSSVRPAQPLSAANAGEEA
ncbi:MAG: glycosyltransferase [Gemmatimonadetes bacterium]|jgi:glycosyltransferase involved in cell wall biosynthesis|nr:glycosyltransferase [Gemmatimonadota bacterium]MBA4156814.1 glycosyltransferase [Gemmatimonadota bacterium]